MTSKDRFMIQSRILVHLVNLEDLDLEDNNMILVILKIDELDQDQENINHLILITQNSGETNMLKVAMKKKCKMNLILSLALTNKVENKQEMMKQKEMM